MEAFQLGGMIMGSRKHWIAILLSLAVLCLSGWAMQGRTSSKPVWEYKIVLIRDDTKAEATLNDLGQQGWELVSHDSQPDSNPARGGEYYFKRTK